MKCYIANFGLQNWGWEHCLARHALVVMDDERVHSFWRAGDRAGYIEIAQRILKGRSGKPVKKGVASRWFSINTTLTGTAGDLWIHRANNELWWTISGNTPPESETINDPHPFPGGGRICVYYKPCAEWSNRDQRGRILSWEDLHPRARKFLTLSGTLRELHGDSGAYVQALINADDLLPWHSRPDWRALTEESLLARQPSRLAPRPDFVVGSEYDRGRDVHDRFGGQRQGGISTPSSFPVIFLFSSDSGGQFGYSDGWMDGVYDYTGEGQEGDMGFRAGNRAIRDHAMTGKDLLLFQSCGKRKGYRYVGQFACGSWEYREGSDVKGVPRRVIVFHLVPIESTSPESTLAGAAHRDTTNLQELRTKAIAASTGAPNMSGRDGLRTYFQRSASVRVYVLARACGVCESCKQQAPFNRVDGSPYLEPHHTKRISDGGPDHPRWVAAICPNCHCRIHHGNDGAEINDALEQYLFTIEREVVADVRL